jgi:hypothetical protein
MRLSDFQIADAPIKVDQALMARNAKKAASTVDWKKTRTTATEGANQPFIALLMDGAAEETESNEPVGEAASVAGNFASLGAQVVGGAAQNLASAAMMESDKSHSALRKKIHDALDKMLDAEAAENPDLYAESNFKHRRAESESEEANPELDPEEEESFTENADDDGFASMQRQLDALLAKDSADDALLDRIRNVVAGVKRDRVRQRLATADEGSARVISSSRDVSHNAGYITDAALIAKHLDPDQLCVEAANQLSDISYKRQADDCARSYWSGLFFFLRSQPKGSRIRDIKNKVCLSTLLMHTVEGVNGVFGA